MKVPQLYRAAGVAGVLAGVLNVIVEFLPDRLGQPLNLLVNTIGLWLLTAFYLRQRAESGRLGFIGYVLQSFGLALAVGLLFTQAFVLVPLGASFSHPALARTAGLAAVIILAALTLGAVLFGAATFRAGVFPRWAAALYMAGFLVLAPAPVLPRLVVTLGEVMVSLGLIGLSTVLLGRAGAGQPNAAPAAAP